jgi:hypothetical protein
MGNACFARVLDFQTLFSESRITQSSAIGIIALPRSRLRLSRFVRMRTKIEPRFDLRSKELRESYRRLQV